MSTNIRIAEYTEMTTKYIHFAITVTNETFVMKLREE
jgi:hypothetical protein